MKKIITSLGMIVFLGAVVAGGTGAFFSDTETSAGNVFTAGALDLKIDNHAWYNGLECANVGTDEDPVYEWTDPAGNAVGDSYLESLVGTTCTGTWELTDLDNHLFFDFDDLKPGDWEEDTISLHIDNNPAWMCANVTITKDDDVDCTEPELLDDASCNNPDVEPNSDNWDGELGEQLNFIFWLDDGDNVYEDDENIMLSGTPDLLEGYGTDGNNGQTFTIADSISSIFGPGGTPVPGDSTFYIGKAFCFGDMLLDPVSQGNNSPANNPGFTCSGELTDNAPQTDSMMADISFHIEQSRHNSAFVCNERDGGIACNEENDVMFVLDSSGSIDETELGVMADAAKAFALALAPATPGNHIGVVDFDGDATLNAELTDVLADIDSAIDALVSGGSTNLADGITLASTELVSVRDRDDITVAPDFMLIMTDGDPDDEADATVAADAAKAAGTTVYVVGIGDSVNDTYLETIASSASHYFTAAEFADLEALLASLADCPDDLVSS